MQTSAKEKTDVAAVPTIQERIAALPQDQLQRSKALETIESELERALGLVRDEQRKLMRDVIEQNTNPDQKLLAGISDRYALSSAYGVSREDFDTVLGEISANEKTTAQLRRLNATGAEMTITSVTDGEIVLIDTVDNVNVEAQEEFLSGLDASERSDAVETLQQRFPEIEQLLQRTDGERGVNYHEYLVICKVTGAEPMPEDTYRELQEHKPVDGQTICWLLTEQERLGRGGALNGGRDGRVVRVSVRVAAGRGRFRAGRPLLRVQRA